LVKASKILVEGERYGEISNLDNSQGNQRAAETQIYQCPDPGPERGGGGTVYFEIEREKVS
jgi:hypothetical protein